MNEQQQIESQAKTVEAILRGMVYTIVGVPQRSWRYGRRCEVRVHAPDVDPRGRGYRDRCEAVHENLDLRHTGPNSRLGMLLERLERSGINPA